MLRLRVMEERKPREGKKMLWNTAKACRTSGGAVTLICFRIRFTVLVCKGGKVYTGWPNFPPRQVSSYTDPDD